MIPGKRHVSPLNANDAGFVFLLTVALIHLITQPHMQNKIMLLKFSVKIILKFSFLLNVAARRRSYCHLCSLAGSDLHLHFPYLHSHTLPRLSLFLFHSHLSPLLCFDASFRFFLHSP